MKSGMAVISVVSLPPCWVAELEKAEAFDRARARDEALEAAARRAEQRPRPAPAEEQADDDDFDVDNPWGARRSD